MIEELSHWYSTKRYNLAAMSVLYDKQKELGKNRPESLINRISRTIPRPKKHWALLAVIWILASVLSGAFVPLPWARILLSLMFTVLIISSVCYGVISCIGDVYWFKKMVPRLFGSIIVGYIPLIMGEEMWKFSRDIHWFVHFMAVKKGKFTFGIVHGQFFVYLFKTDIHLFIP